MIKLKFSQKVGSPEGKLHCSLHLPRFTFPGAESKERHLRPIVQREGGGGHGIGGAELQTDVAPEAGFCRTNVLKCSQR